ncbi:5-formyltetrahydrofolate cyclo-ligase [Fervidibacter sacchari]|jgi:5,10-methenyltetrahydrofolate synthetase|uniref:5-formyltetrahydrofolate cyclo-ligase n=1 Tax=Candidatus Fervidibacter sacchari TaxID=1448929 RepID=A0ABT2EMX4_9BACT|nr:5-formyltetrahydrofolate cyclo-ligase [Candidatus Fervidibacter sacchari]MCS3919200.1 5-formyltetrahydrofolate cyclo-ligase [Candidatus Fervidibacter sacchari]WKU17068.1 5-formyltetrahydrofolate cyclo-ligase [Candidatus Fervidibacter sacchari]
MTKEQIRQMVKERIEAMPPDERFRLTQIILQRARSFLLTTNAQLAAFYMPIPDEIDIVPLIRWWQQRGLQVALPRTLRQEKRLEFRKVNRLDVDLQLGALGILEPKPSCPLVMPEEIELIVVPGRAFDECCNRLGRGLGYYDRFLKNLPERTLKVALAFEFQIVKRIPTKPNDVPMDVVITERRTLMCPK